MLYFAGFYDVFIWKSFAPDNEIASDMTGLIFPARESVDNTTSVLQGGQFLGRETK